MINIENIFKAFDDKVIIQDFSLEIETGDFIVFAGPSGCGKTTLLNIIGGLENVDSGNVIVDGINLSKNKKLKEFYMYKVGFLFQNFALIENKTVRENLEFVQKKARNDISVEEVLEKVNLLDKIDEKVFKLSGGEQQRVAAARLLYKKCDIILADEPTGSLDTQNGNEIMKILHSMNECGKTIILVTHDEKIIEREEKVIMLNLN